MTIDLNKDKELISKRAILQKYNELEIYRKYLDNGQDVVFGTAILSPLRKESKPSFGFFIGEGNEICFNDFVLGKGDFVRFVQMKYGLTYFEALSKVAVDFDLSDDFICKKLDKTRFINDKKNLPTKEELLSQVTSLRLGKKRRNWERYDIEFWLQFGISINTLEFYRVEPISHIFINDKIFVADKYAYVFIEQKDNKETYKIYQPFSKDYKWITSHNSSVWQGWEQLPVKGTDLIITKSLKDVMSLYEVTGIPSVALQTESILPKRHVFNLLKDRFPECIYLFYDNDYDKEINWGKLYGDKIARELGLIDIYIHDRFKSKDFSDLVKNVGKEEAKDILINRILLPF